MTENTTPTIATIPTADPAQHFEKLADLQTAHAALIKRQRESADPAGLLADMVALIRRGQASGAVLDGSAEREDAQSMLDYWATRLVRAGRDLPDTTLAEFDPAQLPTLPDDPCPYRGLEAFTNAAYFFGREGTVT